MKELLLTVQNHTGLHARPAKVLSKLAKKYESKVSIQYGEKEANAKSMISLLKLGVKQSAEICLRVDGSDEVEASQSLADAINSGLGEPLPGIATKSNGDAAVDVAAAEVKADPTNKEEPVITKPDPKPETEAVVAEIRGLRGLPASPGIAIGPVFRLVETEIVLPDRFLGVEEEITSLKAHIDTALTAIGGLRQKMIDAEKADEAEIFEAHREILQDPDLITAVETVIHSGKNGAHAWQSQISIEADKLASLDDPLLAARAADVRDVGLRVLRLLTGQVAEAERPTDPYIILATDLTPSDTVNLDPKSVLGFATSEGGPTAHSAIIARSLGLPAVVGLGKPLDEVENGQIVILNGSTGIVNATPTADELHEAKTAQDAERQASKEAQDAADLPARTTDNHLIEVGGNAGSVQDIETAYNAGADGIGLFRTEFLFLGQESAPDEANQLKSYTAIVKGMQQRPVIFRTLDIGGDKPVPYITVPKEENPFLGERGIRLQLNRPELLRTQLRAIFKAAEFGKVRIMFPMIGRLDEWRAARKIAEEVRVELGAAAVELGMMIEVPSAALMADRFAEEVDFFSVGTNDLTQYTLAIDRQHPTLTAQADGLDPAVLRLIKMTVDAAQAQGKWVGICGELGSDTQAAPILIGLGVQELSVNLKAVARVKAQVRSLSLVQCQAVAKKALACATTADVRALSV